MEKKQAFKLSPKIAKQWQAFSAPAKACRCFWCFFLAYHPSSRTGAKDIIRKMLNKLQKTYKKQAYF